MTEFEKQIWAAAYAAAFIANFESSEKYASERTDQDFPTNFECAAHNVNASRAYDIANLAVEKYRKERFTTKRLRSGSERLQDSLYRKDG